MAIIHFLYYILAFILLMIGDVGVIFGVCLILGGIIKQAGAECLLLGISSLIAGIVFLCLYGIIS